VTVKVIIEIKKRVIAIDSNRWMRYAMLNLAKT